MTMKTLVITLVGPDRPGIVEHVSDCLVRYKANWLGSSMSLMAGQFAGIVEVCLPEEQVNGLRHGLTQLEGLAVQVADGEPSATSAQAVIPIEFQVTANDRPGIVQQVAACLSGLGINVLQLETQCESAAHFGGELFTANVTAQLPQGLPEEQLWQALESLSDDLIIDMD